MFREWMTDVRDSRKIFAMLVSKQAFCPHLFIFSFVDESVHMFDFTWRGSLCIEWGEV